MNTNTTQHNAPRVTRQYVIQGKRRLRTTRYGVMWTHANPDGGPVPRNEISWRNINGVLVNYPCGYVFLLFRRPTIQVHLP